MVEIVDLYEDDKVNVADIIKEGFSSMLGVEDKCTAETKFLYVFLNIEFLFRFLLDILHT